jgi:hypothetical protein
MGDLLLIYKPDKHRCGLFPVRDRSLSQNSPPARQTCKIRLSPAWERGHFLRRAEFAAPFDIYLL